jgi:uncharacterized DUF497 family protein
LESLSEPHVKHLAGKLWELRLTGRDGIARARLYLNFKIGERGRRRSGFSGFVALLAAPERSIPLLHSAHGEAIVPIFIDRGAPLRKHDVTFDQTATVLLDALALTIYDQVNSHDKERWFTLGLDANGRLLAVAHTYEITGANVRVRIISARKATKRERRSYEDEPR